MRAVLLQGQRGAGLREAVRIREAEGPRETGDPRTGDENVLLQHGLQMQDNARPGVECLARKQRMHTRLRPVHQLRQVHQLRPLRYNKPAEDVAGAPVRE